MIEGQPDRPTRAAQREREVAVPTKPRWLYPRSRDARSVKEHAAPWTHGGEALQRVRSPVWQRRMGIRSGHHCTATGHNGRYQSRIGISAILLIGHGVSEWVINFMTPYSGCPATDGWRYLLREQ